MQPPVFAVIRVRLVAGVDDGPVELHPLVDVVYDVIGALRDLEVDRRRVAAGFPVEGKGIGLAHPARASEDLPRGEKREQRVQRGRVELHLAAHEVVLMAAESRAGVVIDVVLEKGHLPGPLQCRQRALQKRIPRQVVGHGVPQRAAFRRGIFKVAHVDVEPPAVQQKTAVARRLLVVAVVEVDRAELRLAEDVVLHAGRPGIGAALRLVGLDQAAIFRLDAHDAVHEAQTRPELPRGQARLTGLGTCAE